MNFNMVITIIEILIRFGLPILIFAMLFIGYMQAGEFFKKCFLDKRVLALLILAAISTSIINIPIFIRNDVMLAINLGSVIIPIILSLYFIFKLKPNPGILLIMVFIISFITFLLTDIDPDIGVISDFPWYMIPILISVLFSFFVSINRLYLAVPFAYSISTLGVFIGADIARLPIIFEEDIMIGYIGGLGIFDLIFITGLFSLALTLGLVYSFSNYEIYIQPRESKFKKPNKVKEGFKKITNQETEKVEVNKLLPLAWKLFEEKQYDKALESAIKALVLKLDMMNPTKVKVTISNSPQIIKNIGLSKIYQSDFLLLLNLIKSSEVTQEDAYRSLVTAEKLVFKLESLKQKRYAPIKKRLIAFGIDIFIQCLIILLIMTIIWLLLDFNYNALFNGIWGYSIFWWAVFIHLIYFIIPEWYFGQTPGKRYAKIKVVSVEPKIRRVKLKNFSADFISIFTRNTLRIVDLFMIFWSVFKIINSPSRQRIGDHFAGTKVVNI